MALALRLLVLAGLLVLPGPTLARDTTRLDELRKEIEEREARATELRKEAKGVLGELEGMDRELHEVRRSVSLLRERRRMAELDLVEARGQLRTAGQRRSRVQDQLERRLVALYKFHSTGGLPAFYSAGTFQGLLLRREALTRVVEEDELLFARFRKAEAEWAGSRDRASGLLGEIEQAGREVTKREDRVRESLVERRNLVALLHSRADQEKKVIGELREAARRLERLLAERKGESWSGAGLRRGALPPPVAGSLRLGFGSQIDPEFGTRTLRNGIELAAPVGEPVRAVARGRILFAGWFKGYGQIVILDHGAGDVTVSGFLADRTVKAGAVVDRGDVIGRVGETGSLSGPGLYFEIRHDGRPEDPVEWFGQQSAKGTR